MSPLCQAVLLLVSAAICSAGGYNPWGGPGKVPSFLKPSQFCPSSLSWKGDELHDCRSRICHNENDCLTSEDVGHCCVTKCGGRHCHFSFVPTFSLGFGQLPYHNFCPGNWEGEQASLCSFNLCHSVDDCTKGKLQGTCCITRCRGRQCFYPETPAANFPPGNVEDVSDASINADTKAGGEAAEGSEASGAGPTEAGSGATDGGEASGAGPTEAGSGATDGGEASGAGPTEAGSGATDGGEASGAGPTEAGSGATDGGEASGSGPTEAGSGATDGGEASGAGTTEAGSGATDGGEASGAGTTEAGSGATDGGEDAGGGPTEAGSEATEGGEASGAGPTEAGSEATEGGEASGAGPTEAGSEATDGGEAAGAGTTEAGSEATDGGEAAGAGTTEAGSEATDGGEAAGAGTTEAGSEATDGGEAAGAGTTEVGSEATDGGEAAGASTTEAGSEATEGTEASAAGASKTVIVIAPVKVGSIIMSAGGASIGSLMSELSPGINATSTVIGTLNTNVEVADLKCPATWSGERPFVCGLILCNLKLDCVVNGVQGKCCPTACGGRNCLFLKMLSVVGIPENITKNVEVSALNAGNITSASAGNVIGASEDTNISAPGAAAASLNLVTMAPVMINETGSLVKASSAGGVNASGSLVIVAHVDASAKVESVVTVASENGASKVGSVGTVAPVDTSTKSGSNITVASASEGAVLNSKAPDASRRGNAAGNLTGAVGIVEEADDLNCPTAWAGERPFVCRLNLCNRASDCVVNCVQGHCCRTMYGGRNCLFPHFPSLIGIPDAIPSNGTAVDLRGTSLNLMKVQPCSLSGNATQPVSN